MKIHTPASFVTLGDVRHCQIGVECRVRGHTTGEEPGTGGPTCHKRCPRLGHLGRDRQSFVFGGLLDRRRQTDHRLLAREIHIAAFQLTEFKQDINGDGDFLDNKEDEDRTHNQANEITSLDIQGMTGTPFSQHRDKAGNLTRLRRRNAVDTRYTHDAWNRLVKVELGTVPVGTKGEYEDNGLHWRIVREIPSGSAVEERRMYYSASWHLLEERIDSDNTDNSEVWNEEAAAQIVWGLRYIDDAVLRRTDNDQDYNYTDAGERTDYYITDPQFSVCAVIDDTGGLQERVSYSAYGEAQHHFPGDIDGDGDLDSTDTGSYSFKDIDEAGYNPDADINRDGTVNSTDLIWAFNNNEAALAGGQLSDPDGVDGSIGYDGYLFNAETKLYTVRFRHYEPKTGRWLERDPLGHVDGMSMLRQCR